MIIRTSKAKEPSFILGSDEMVENNLKPYRLYRSVLKQQLKNKQSRISYFIRSFFKDDYEYKFFGRLTQGETQRGKKYIQIGCKRFVGENRRKLIAWAKGAK